MRALLIGLVVAGTLAGCGDDEPPPPAPTVAVAEVIRGGLVITREGFERVVREPLRVEQGAAAVTAADGRGVLRLDNGAWLVLDRETRVSVALGAVTLESGRVWLDTARAQPTELSTAHGKVTAQGATLAVAIDGGATSVYCASGEATFDSERGDGTLARGERVALGGAEPVVEGADLWEDWTGGLADPAPPSDRGAPYVGRLAGRRLDELGHARTSLPIRGHEARARVLGDLAITEVVQTFFNARSDVLEAEYSIRLPEGAIVQTFAVDAGSGGFVEAGVSSLATERGYFLSWADPSTPLSSLSYDGPDRYRARVFPVQPGATVRIRMSYTQWLTRRGDTRTYVYPMRTDGEPPLVGELSLEVDATGTRVGAYRAGMGARVEGGRVVLRQSDFRPFADFYLDLVDPADAERPLDVARAHVIGPSTAENQAGISERYVLVDVPTAPLVPEATEGEPPPLELVLLVDVSGATDVEDLELARAVVDSVLRQLAPTDRVTLRIGDVRARSPEGAPGELQAASEETREQILGALARVDVGGATDLGAMLREAATVVAGRPRGAVLYLGDALPTTGALDATALRGVLSTLEAPPRFFALAVGDGANVDLLRALFGRAGVQLVEEATSATRAAMGVLADAARPTLRRLDVDLGPSVERVHPSPPLEVALGEPVRLVGRLRGDLPAEIAVHGQVDGVAFERTLRLVPEALQDEGGDIRRRWAAGRLAELVDADAGREALVELGVRFGVVTPWTSLVVGYGHGSVVQPIRGFDLDPVEIPWALGGRAPRLSADTLDAGRGWRRRARLDAPDVATQPEMTWVSRVPEGTTADPIPAGEDGGLGRAAVTRALELGRRGPDTCYERKLVVRPDLQGDVSLEVSVDGAGAVRDVSMLSSTVGDRDVEACVLTEVRGLAFPATSAATAVQTVRHVYRFAVAEGSIGVQRQCSDASRQSLDVRRALWRERLAANAGPSGALAVYRDAHRQCELPSWRARRTLLTMMLRHVGGVAGQVQLYRAFGPGSSIAGFLRRAILLNVRTPQDVLLVRAGLGLDVPVQWWVFARQWKSNDDPEARLRLVRRWLEVAPDEMDLRLRLLALLEELGRHVEARRLARELRADPLADARVRTSVGEFWLRQEQPDEARRVFSEIVENTPLDPWARERLGDLYRAHGWSDDAYREYQTLARLRPGDDRVLVSLARAAAGAGRTDEALRLEQRVSESADDDVDEGVSAFARLWTTVRLSRMKLDADDAMRRALARRERSTGALRDPPAVFVALTWSHPDDRPALLIRHPGTPDEEPAEPAPLSAKGWGIEAIRIREREEGVYRLEVHRSERDELRDVRAELLVIVAPGTPQERILREEIVLTRQARQAWFALEGAELRALPPG